MLPPLLLIHADLQILADWRRDNVNILIKQINDTIQSIKPYVKFGMSPFGIWKNGVPPGITGLSAYDDIYCDAIAWLQKRSIDYLTPQLYWPFGGGQDYAKLQPWWADSAAANGRHYYPGHAYYRIPNWSNPSEIPNQIRLDRSNPKVQGGVFFRAKNFPENPKGITDSLRNDLYRYTALNPKMSWKDVVPPNPIQNLRFERLENGQAGLKWDLPQKAGDGDSAKRYVVYRFNYSNVQPADLDNSANILNIEGFPESIPGVPPSPTGPYYFVVTSLDRNYNESTMSSVLQVNAPSAPTQLFPSNGSLNVGDTVILKWNYPALASTFRLQISTDPTFTSGIVLDQSNIADTFKVVTGLSGQTQYYWRINSSNAGGTGSFSSGFAFKTGFPVTPDLSYPVNNTGNIPLDTILYWYSAPTAESYRIIIARGADFASNTIFADTSGLMDTTFSVTGLNTNTFYFWKVKVSNQYGTSNWSASWRFKTINPTGVESELNSPTEFSLYQSHPNPFNPVTQIRYTLPQLANVQLKIYDILGREVKTLINSEQPAGAYRVEWNGTNNYGTQVSSGMYIYRIVAGKFVQTKKMMFLK